MNERIQELIEQATESKGFLTAGNSVPPLPVKEFNKEKFADLIIQECLLALEPNLYESDIEYRVDQAFYKKCERIKKHFGVE